MTAADFNAVTNPPFSLKLEFSKAADYNRINAVFDPAIKHSFDPHDYVLKREEGAFTHSIDNGAAAFLADAQTGTIDTLTIAYRLYEPDASGQMLHNYTELGTTLSRLPGYHSARLIVAATALREWWQAPPREAMIADIKHTNVPSLKTYRDALGWEMVQGKAENLHISAVADTTLANDADKNAEYDTWSADAAWYSPSDRSLALQARAILAFMAQGGLVHKKTGHHIAVDFSALAGAGLTRPRLEALARGETSRTKLQQLPPAPSP